MSQLIHQEYKKSSHSKEIIIVCENIRTPENLGMIFRVSEAFGCKKVFVLGDSPSLDNKKVQRTARNTDKTLDVTYSNELENTIEFLLEDNFSLYALELTSISTSLDKINMNESKIALFVGAERQGLSEEALKLIPQHVHINLFGENSSINVVNALSIALFQLTKS